MAKQPTRLADFQIPREVTPESMAATRDGVEPAGAAAALGDALRLKVVPRPAAEQRLAITTRLPVSMHERLRVFLFASRKSQQDTLEEALDAYLRANGC